MNRHKRDLTIYRKIGKLHKKNQYSDIIHEVGLQLIKSLGWV